MQLIDNDGNQLIINSSLGDEGASNIFMRKIIIDGGDADCIQFNNSSGIFVMDCIANGSAGGNGIHVNACDYLVMQRCTLNDNTDCGIALRATDNSNQQFGATNFALESCNVMANTTGICFEGFNTNGFVTDCIAESNIDGVRFDESGSQGFDSVRNVIIDNVVSQNSSYGIYIGDRTKNNFFGFNQMYKNEMANYKEVTGGGPNSLLGNFSFHTSVESAYEPGLTMVNTATIMNTASFTDEPTYWINIAMTE